MSLLEDVKRITEKATGWKRPDDPGHLLRERKSQTYRFRDDGLIPNHPRWPLVIYKSAVRLPEALDPAAVFEDLFESNDGAKGPLMRTWRKPIQRQTGKKRRAPFRARAH
jgi:hypothetical protein